jgi:hypothetical protein
VNPRLRQLVRALARVALCGVLLLWIFHSIFVNEARTSTPPDVWRTYDRLEQWRHGWRDGPPRLWAALTAVEFPALAVSFVVMGGTLLLGILRWRMVLRVQGLELSLPRAAEISFVAHFFNSFLLGSAGGDLMKAWYAARETKHKKTEAVVTVFVDRLVGLWAMLLFAVVMMAFNTRLLFAHERLRPVALFIVALFVACTAFVMLAFWGGVSRGWGGARAWLRRLPKGDWLERSLDSCRRFGQERGFLFRALLLSTLLNLLCVAQFMVLARGLGLAIAPQVLLLAVPTVICIAAIPLTPSGLGVRENLLVLLLAHPDVGADPTRALSLSLLAYAGSLFWSLIGGVVYATLRDKHRLGEAELGAARDA